MIDAHERNNAVGSVVTPELSHSDGVGRACASNGNTARPTRSEALSSGVTPLLDGENELRNVSNYNKNALGKDPGKYQVSNCIDGFGHFLQNLPKGKRFYFQAQTNDSHVDWSPGFEPIRGDKSKLGFKPETRSDALVSFVDLMPIFLDVAGLPKPTYLPGKSKNLMKEI